MLCAKTLGKNKPFRKSVKVRVIFKTVLPHADGVVLVDQVLGTGGGGFQSSSEVADIVEVVNPSRAGGAAQVVLEATLGAGSVLQSCHVLAVVVSDVDVPRPGGGRRTHVDVDVVACRAITVHDHCKVQVDILKNLQQGIFIYKMGSSLTHLMLLKC